MERLHWPIVIELTIRQLAKEAMGEVGVDDSRQGRVEWMNLAKLMQEFSMRPNTLQVPVTVAIKL